MSKFSIDVEKIRGRISEAKNEKITKGDLKDLLGVSHVTLINWENVAPNVVFVLKKASELTGLPMEELIKEI